MKNLRKGFPVLEQYTYLNIPASGLLSEKLLEFRQEHDLDFLIGGSIFREKTDQILTDTRKTIGDFYNCKPANIALLPNFAFGFNLLLEGIPKKSKILLLKNDYPDINLAVEARNFSVSYAEINENLEENIEQAVAKYQPDFFAFSIVQWINGIKVDLRFLTRLKQKFPNLTLIADGTQYCGTENFDFENSAIDVLGASTYKWLNAGYGNSFFLFKEEAKDTFSAKARGFGTTMGTYKEKRDNFIGTLEPGHLDTLNFGSLKAALDQQTKTGVEKIQQQIRTLSAKAKSEFEKLGLLEEMVIKRKNHSSIFNIKGDDVLFNRLHEKGIICSQRGTGIRVGFHYFNTEEELEILLRAIRTN